MKGRTKARREAIELGNPRYHGKVCERHDISERWTASGNCIECARESARNRPPEVKLAKSRRDYANNPESSRRSAARYRARNPEKVLSDLREWRAKNADAVKAYGEAYRESHKPQRALLQRLRKARQRAAGMGLSDADKKAIKALYAQAVELGMHVDHIVPLAGCRECGSHGLHVPANLQLLSPQENCAKQDLCGDCWHERKHKAAA